MTQEAMLLGKPLSYFSAAARAAFFAGDAAPAMKEAYEDSPKFVFADDGSTGFYAETIDGPLCFAEEGTKIGKWIFVPEPTAPNRAVRPG